MRTILISMVVIFGMTKASIAQVKDPEVKAAAFLTISPNKLFEDKETNFYLHGQLKFFTEQHISISGDLFYDLGGSPSHSLPELQHQLLFGANYHWCKNRNDFNLGFQPGIGLTKIANESYANSKLTPLVSLSAGYSIYVSKHLHFFIESRYVAGQVISNSVKNISSLRFSAGLGFQL